MADYTIKKGNNYPTIVFTCTDKNGNAVDLTTAAGVRVIISSTPTSVPKVDQDLVGGNVVVSDAINGQVTYTWQSGDLDTVGGFVAEVEVTWPGSNVQTFPTSYYITLYVEQNLG